MYRSISWKNDDENWGENEPWDSVEQDFAKGELKFD